MKCASPYISGPAPHIYRGSVRLGPSLTAADEDPFFRRWCARLRSSGLVVHAEKGDGGLTDAERATLDAAPLVTVVAIPGAVFFLPDEAPRQIAEVTGTALKQTSRC